MKGSEENKQFDPGGERGVQPPPWNAAVMVVVSFHEESAGPGVPVVCALCSFPVCSGLYPLFLSGDHRFNELKSMRVDVDQVADVRNRRVSTF